MNIISWSFIEKLCVGPNQSSHFKPKSPQTKLPTNCFSMEEVTRVSKQRPNLIARSTWGFISVGASPDSRVWVQQKSEWVQTWVQTQPGVMSPTVEKCSIFTLLLIFVELYTLNITSENQLPWKTGKRHLYPQPSVRIKFLESCLLQWYCIVLVMCHSLSSCLAKQNKQTNKKQTDKQTNLNKQTKKL